MASETTIANKRIGRTVTEEAKQWIVDILSAESTINSISTDLVQKAEQYTVKIAVPEKYLQHAQVFSEEATQRFPPKRPWVLRPMSYTSDLDNLHKSRGRRV